MAKVICFASPKGGSGKTMVCASFGTALAGLGYRVTMIDTDSATNGLSLLYLKEVVSVAGGSDGDEQLASAAERRGLFDVEKNSGVATAVALRKNLRLVPATIRFANTEQVAVELFQASLLEAVSFYGATSDFVLLDAQAGADTVAHFALSRKVCDEVVIVSEYDPMSAAGIERLKAIFRDELTYERTWILLNKMLPEFVTNFREFLSIAKYLSPLPWNAEVVRAYARRSLAINLDQPNDHTLAVIQCLRTLLGEDVDKRYAEWTTSKTEELREPLEVEYLKLQEQLRSLYSRRSELEARKLFGLISALIVAIVGGGMTAAKILDLADYSWPTQDPGVFIILAMGGSLMLFLIFSIPLIRTRSRLTAGQAEIDRLVEGSQERLRRVEALLAADADSLIRQRVLG